MIVSTVAAIQIKVLWNYFLPVSIIALTIGLLTTLVVIYLGKRIWSYNLERTVAIYGTVTGTVSCGLLLLRIVDPDFETPVAIEIAIMNVFSLPIIAGCMVLVNAPMWWNWSIWLTVLAFVGIMSIALAQLTGFPLTPSFQVIVMGFAVSILTGVLSGLLPARRAAKLHPVDALRHE